MSKGKLVTPKLWLVGFDETEYWSEEVQAAAGRVVRYGVWDENEMSFLCSLTPSGYVHLSGLFFTQKRVSDEIDEIIHMNLEYGGDYYDYHTLNARTDKLFLKSHTPAVKEWKALLREHDGEREAAYAEMIEGVLEYLRGNTMECELAAAMGIEFDYSEDEVNHDNT